MTARLDEHDREFRSLLARARSLLDRGQWDRAATACQVAAHYAWLNHSGWFGSGELEAICHRLAQECLPRHHSAAAAASDPRVVMHVATQVYATGGSTQAIASWMELDSGRKHRLCLTRQGPTEVATKIASRIEDADDLLRLDTHRGGLLSRARRLRAATARADAVVLHTHPYDVLPVIAFSVGFDGPPVIYVNHADHVFWVGASVSNIVLNMRDSGAALAAHRRSIEAGRCVVASRPLRVPERSVSREEAKQAFGIAADQVLVVTAADAAKYRAIEPPSLLDMVLPALEAEPRLGFLAAGPAPQGEWLHASERTQGRVRALGRLLDVSMLHQAADIYLDSFPFSSLTSMLEAGAFGAALVSYRGHPDDCAVLGADTRGVDEHMARPRTPDELQRELAVLARDRALRESRGMRARDAILATHRGDAWTAALRDVYRLAASLPPPATLPDPQRSSGRLDQLVDLVMQRTGYSLGLPGAIRDSLGLLEPTQRALKWFSLVHSPARPSVRNLFPEWVLPHLAPWWRRARQLAHPPAVAATGHRK